MSLPHFARSGPPLLFRLKKLVAACLDETSPYNNGGDTSITPFTMHDHRLPLTAARGYGLATLALVVIFAARMNDARAEGSPVPPAPTPGVPAPLASPSAPDVALPRIAIEERYLTEVPAQTAAEPERWFSKGVNAIYYEGPTYKGKPTKVFAYYGLPDDLNKGEKVPAMVLVHGGGGTAFAEWVRLWNSRGYAAISMDLCGCVPVKDPRGNIWLKLPVSGGPPGWDFSFTQVNDPLQDQWPYYAVNAIARARTLLGAQPEVDASKIGITGISWGGYLTCIVAGIDHRYNFAVPVYGCGFLRDGGSAWSARLMAPGMERWTSQCDPSAYLGQVTMPILWVTSNHDPFYPMEALKMSYSLVKAPVSLSIKTRMAHGHGGPGELPEEIKAFADSFCKGGKPLSTFVDQGASGGVAWAVFKSAAPLQSAELVYTKDTGPNKSRRWESSPATLDASSGKVSAAVPAGVKMYYFNVHDSPDMTISSPYLEAGS